MQFVSKPKSVKHNVLRWSRLVLNKVGDMNSLQRVAIFISCSELEVVWWVLAGFISVNLGHSWKTAG